MNDDQLRKMIRSLPRHDASDGFEQSLRGRLQRERQAPRAAPSYRRWALAAALTVILAGSASVGLQRRSDRILADRRSEEIRMETEAIRQELLALRREAEQSTEIYLGGSPGGDYVLDLTQFGGMQPEVRRVSNKPVAGRAKY